MLGSASLQGARKGTVSSSLGRSKRNIVINALSLDASSAPSVSRRSDKQQSRTVAPGILALSTVAANLLAANLTWAEVPDEALISLQAAEPLTEISEVAAPAILIDAAVPPPVTDAVAEVPVPEPAPVAALTAAESAPAPEAPAALITEVIDIEPVYIEAEPAVASPVISMDIPAMPAVTPETDLKTLVAALIRNEQFIAALVNNEAFLDRLAGEDKVVQELARRKGLSVEVEARDELATELRRRQMMMDALAARGEEAVLAVADAAKQAAEEAARAARTETRDADVTGEVGVVSSGKSALVAMGTAVELLEDSQELLQAVESNPAASSLAPLANDDRQLQREFKKMEAAVARAEQSVSKTLESSGSEPLPAIQEAVRDLYTGSEQENDVTINRAYTDLVTAVAEMQRAYGTAISKAVGHAVSEVVEVEEAALEGAEKTKKLMSQKAEEVEKIVGIGGAAPKPIAGASDQGEQGAAPADRTETSTVGALRVAVIAAFLFWVWGTFVQPRSRYSR